MPELSSPQWARLICGMVFGVRAAGNLREGSCQARAQADLGADGALLRAVLAAGCPLVKVPQAGHCQLEHILQVLCLSGSFLNIPAHGNAPAAARCALRHHVQPSRLCPMRRPCGWAPLTGEEAAAQGCEELAGGHPAREAYCCCQD